MSGKPAARRESAGVAAVDPMAAMRRFTPARIGLARAGTSLSTDEVLQFSLAHALARDAVHQPLSVTGLQQRLRASGYGVTPVTSRAPDRRSYLLRPDLGRRLSDESRAALATLAATPGYASPDVVFVLADGLSSVAVDEQACALLDALQPMLGDIGLNAPVIIATQARVALGDEVGELLSARLVVVCIGERPGLSTPHSLGVYLTHGPRVGTADSARNCVSNIHATGLSSSQAAQRLAWLIRAALARGMTGVGLKDDSQVALDAPAEPARIERQ